MPNRSAILHEAYEIPGYRNYHTDFDKHRTRTVHVPTNTEIECGPISSYMQPKVYQTTFVYAA